jgi:hypothetical protein
MSISPLSSVLSVYSSAQSSQGSGNSRWQDFTELSKALQSGDLGEAQQAYSALQQAGGLPSSATSNNGPVTADFTALGKALSSGNLSQAQSAFSQLQSDIKTAQTTPSQGSTASQVHGHRHHRHGGGSADGDSAQSSTATNATANTTAGGLINLLG